MLIRTAVVTTAVFALTACGGGGGGDPVAKGLPKCSSVWVVGKTLPKSYDGCTDKTGALVPALSYDCKDGTKLTMSDTAFARYGGKIQARTDAAYAADFDKCKGL